ncbi:hypothetical protein AHIS1636_17560 [Arthrobacter mangrovi]|uniref:Uncharacterized protein n=1 Tax=Arthrobacter mangrovi TaxID=2966350 RepID=A0ABQ5MTI8_9MICC|nr:hypothetical protein AHIS1636_17560 [Arthrobacter mangrovi]
MATIVVACGATASAAMPDGIPAVRAPGSISGALRARYSLNEDVAACDIWEKMELCPPAGKFMGY